MPDIHAGRVKAVSGLSESIKFGRDGIFGQHGSLWGWGHLNKTLPKYHLVFNSVIKRRVPKLFPNTHINTMDSIKFLPTETPMK